MYKVNGKFSILYLFVRNHVCKWNSWCLQYIYKLAVETSTSKAVEGSRKSDWQYLLHYIA